MEQKVLVSMSVSGLNDQVSEYIKEGWYPVGSHQVVVTHVQNRFSGTVHKDSIYSIEYSQTMRKDKYLSIQVYVYVCMKVGDIIYAKDRVKDGFNTSLITGGRGYKVLGSF